MGKPVKVPDPVYKRIEHHAEREDITRGAVVREWMDKAERFEQLEGQR
jgi:hypothetical protein